MLILYGGGGGRRGCVVEEKQDGWELLVCESWVFFKIDASEDGVVSCST